MKKILFALLVPVLSMLLGSLVTACDDNDNFSRLHVLTDEELAELARQEHIKDSLRQVINADLILEYNLTDYPITAWSNQPLYLDMDKVAELFGLTVDEVYAGIAGADGAPAIAGFAINGSDHADNLTASTTNGVWGHWWSTKGDLCSAWNQDDSFFFCEWDYEWDENDNPIYNTGHFAVGQFPDRWGAGTKATVLEGLKYQGKRVVFMITLEVIPREAVVATVVNTQPLQISMAPNVTGSYDPTPLKFDLQKTLGDLGVSALSSPENLIAYMPDGSWAQEVGDNGWWFNKQGTVGSWGSDASAWISYGYCEEDEIGVCLMPNNGAAGGDQYVINFGFIANNKIEMLEVTINVVDGDDPNSAPIVNTQEINVDIPNNIANTYDPNPVKFNLSQALADLGVGSLSDAYMVTYTEDGDITMALNADSGFWMDKSGPIGGWGENASCWISYGLLEDDEIGLCLMPGATEVGDSFHHYFGFFANGKIEMLDLHVNVVDYTYDDPETPPAGNPTNDTVLDITLEKPWTDDYAAVEADIRDALRNAFKMTTHQIYMASLDGSLRLYNKELTDEPVYTGGGIENWLDLNGDYAGYGDGSAVYCGIDATNDYIEIYAGNFPDEELCPQNSTVKTTYLVCCNGGMVTINVTIKIGAAAAEPEE